MMFARRGLLFALLLLAVPSLFGTARAEPYLAVREGVKCSTCHANPTGGGMRNEYGNMYAQMQLAAKHLASPDAERWTGRINRFVGAGGNLRANATYVDVPGEDSESQFELDETRLYLNFTPVPGSIQLYVDQKLSPGASTNLEAWARYVNGNWYIKAGRMFLPYGLRLEDDSTFIRSVPGINFTTPDIGAELGFETANWSAQLAVSNGTAGGSEIDDGKQASFRLERVQSQWRAGVSLNVNDTEAGTRQMQNVFAGIRTGPVAWLAEVDFIRDESFPGGTLEQRVALLEANWNFLQGHNLKLTTEYLEPNENLPTDERERYGVYWEYFPFEYTQLRVGAQTYVSDSGIAVDERDVLIVQVHGFF